MWVEKATVGVTTGELIVNVLPAVSKMNVIVSPTPSCPLVLEPLVMLAVHVDVAPAAVEAGRQRKG